MKGILFKSDMVKAIVEGRKTQTRRKHGNLTDVLQPPDGWVNQGLASDGEFWFFNKSITCNHTVKPRYQVGDTVYIKEALQRIPRFYVEYTGYHTEAIYKIDGKFVDGVNWVWKHDTLSPMFLPEALARYFIEILDVKAQRLQEITFRDARAEGILTFDSENHDPTNDGVGYNRGAPGLPMRYESTIAYMDLWNSINKPPYDWESNCWVFVYTFKLADKGAE